MKSAGRLNLSFHITSVTHFGNFVIDITGNKGIPTLVFSKISSHNQSRLSWYRWIPVTLLSKYICIIIMLWNPPLARILASIAREGMEGTREFMGWISCICNLYYLTHRYQENVFTVLFCKMSVQVLNDKGVN